MSSVKMGDRNASAQLVEGFYSIENNWRWTAKQLAVLLAPPAGSKQAGATFKFKFTITDAAAKAYGAQTVAGKIGATDLRSQKFDGAGSYEYTAPVPAAALQDDIVRAELTLDKSFKAPGDERELAVIALLAELAAK